MTSNHPKRKPLHRIRNIRSARHSAEHFPHLAAPLFDPAHARATIYDPYDPLWRGTGGWRAVAPPTVPPQPTMREFYDNNTNHNINGPAAASLYPVPFASAEAQAAYRAQWPTAGFVPFVKNGNDQLKRMLAAGLDPRQAPAEAEVRRRAEEEARVQGFRDRMTVGMVVENSGGREGRERGGFPGWEEDLVMVQKEGKAVAAVVVDNHDNNKKRNNEEKMEQAEAEGVAAAAQSK